MESLSKIVSRQDAQFKLTPCTSNETSINLPTDISELIGAQTANVQFTIHKEDFIKAIGVISLYYPLFNKKETEPTKTTSTFDWLTSQMESQFGDNEIAKYEVEHLVRGDGRFYLKGLKLANGFCLRSFLIEQFSTLVFSRTDENELILRIVTSIPTDFQTDNTIVKQSKPSANTSPQIDFPLQQIFFGAPGTGKSHTINEVCAIYENYRTTFHPDTDYAAFVGSYKPITTRVPVYGIQGTKLRDEKNETILEDRIVYRYVFQAFLKAYIAAWKEQKNENPKPVFLVIEEINRGNCAQIFGDIFQLLDRNESGYSDYPIVADDDLAQELKKVFGSLIIAKHEEINALYKGGKDVVASVLDGSQLLLPNNMYIWATMNTSDQSLFPIDSAFKRRWDWKYIKIKNARKDYKIVFANGHQYDWWGFVTEINKHIEGGEIQQEDKKLGYFFAKAKEVEPGKFHIPAEKFLSKVIFFLYNDVFKDFGLDDEIFKDGEDTLTFASYFDEEGNVAEDKVELFLANLGLSPSSDVEPSDDTTDKKAAFGKFVVNGVKSDTITWCMYIILREIAKSHTFDEVKGAVEQYITREDNSIIKQIEDADTYKKENGWLKDTIKSSDNIPFVVTNQWKAEYIPMVKALAEAFNLPFEQTQE